MTDRIPAGVRCLMAGVAAAFLCCAAMLGGLAPVVWSWATPGWPLQIAAIGLGCFAATAVCAAFVFGRAAVSGR